MLTTSDSMDTPSKPPRELPRKFDVMIPNPKPPIPIGKTIVEDSDADGSAEEEIVTAGARRALNDSPPPAPRPNVVTFETHRLPGEESSEEESSDSESVSEGSEVPSVQPQDTGPRHVGFPPVEELPDWFPENIKQIYRVDRHGGALSYKVSRPSLLKNRV
jgi:hypothetical protein